MTKDKQTTRHLRGKVSSLVGSPLATSHSSSNGKKPLRGQKIANFSMWQRTTRRHGILFKKQPQAWMLGYKKCKNHLSRGLFLLPGLREPLGKEGPIPSPGELWKGLSKSVLRIASAIHDLNMCRPDIFKVDLDDTCNAKLFSNGPVEWLKTVKESNKAGKQLTGHKRKCNVEYPRSSHSTRSSFLFHHWGNHQQGYSRRRNYKFRGRDLTHKWHMKL